VIDGEEVIKPKHRMIFREPRCECRYRWPFRHNRVLALWLEMTSFKFVSFAECGQMDSLLHILEMDSHYHCRNKKKKILGLWWTKLEKIMWKTDLQILQ